MKPILEIQHISKKFKINHEQQPYLSLRDSISNLFKSTKSTEDFYALKDVTFNVEQGDTIGIIGKNGAGKSTLLKILSKITPPTSGKIICRGRIASLLEVGTGFHPELTGRENIFMNGSILGMLKIEILKNFDAIVDFAGIEKFIDTPLKHYSSGMQLRLAFAVAAFLENEILIIDEVLAVGDAEFQKKCMGKMGEVSKSGRTILLVSHQMGVLKSLCNKGIRINNGISEAFININDAITAHLKSYNDTSETLINISKQTKEIKVNTIECKDIEGNSKNEFLAGDLFNTEICFELFYDSPQVIIAIGFISSEGASVRTVWSKPQNLKVGVYKIQFSEKNIYFGAGNYNLSIGISSNEINLIYIQDCHQILFENTINKELALRSDCGFILNQMDHILIQL